MRFLQVYYNNPLFNANKFNYTFCYGIKNNNSLKSINNMWIYNKPGTDIYTNFYLEIVL